MVLLDGGGSIGFGDAIVCTCSRDMYVWMCVCIANKNSVRRRCQKVEMKFKVHIVVNIRRSKINMARMPHIASEWQRLQNSLFIAL